MASATMTGLIAIRDNILARLQEVTASANPNYTTTSGQSVSKADYLNTLYQNLEKAEERIRYQETREDGPYEIEVRGFT
jgi:hypothetical protein